MANIIKNRVTEKFLPRLTPMNAYEIYLSQVRSAIEPIRYQQRGLSYIPPQLGGISGQRKVLEQNLVLQTIDFEVNE